MADGSDEDSCFLRDADITEIGCAAVRAAAAASPAATLLDLKNNSLLRGFGGLSQLFPNLQSLVLSNNVLGECSPSAPASWAAALVSASRPAAFRCRAAAPAASSAWFARARDVSPAQSTQSRAAARRRAGTAYECVGVGVAAPARRV